MSASGLHAARWLITSAFLLLTALPASPQSVILGVLEDVPPSYSNEIDHPAIRVVFRFDGKTWTAFPSNCRNQACLRTVVAQYPPTLRWSIAYHGRKLATLSSHAPAAFDFYTHIGLQVLDPPYHVPWVGVKSDEFAGFAGVSVYRPLIASSKRFLADPDRWTPLPVPIRIQAALRRSFRRWNPKLCKWDQAGDSRSIPYQYTDSEIAIVKAFRSNRGDWLAQLQLDGAGECDEMYESGDPWFLVKPDGSTTHLRDGMELLDIGDFDNDGTSEVLFSVAGYNLGGYELFFNHLTEHVSFEFSYH